MPPMTRGWPSPRCARCCWTIPFATATLQRRARGPAWSSLRQRIAERNRDELLGLEAEAAGSGHAWGEWLSAVSLQLAVEFLTRELVLEPGDTTAWMLRAKASTTLGDLDAASEDLGFLEVAAGSREVCQRLGRPREPWPPARRPA